MATGLAGDEWLVVWTGGPAVHAADEIAELTGIADLAAAEDDLGITRRTPVFVRPDLTLDDRLVEFVYRSKFRSFAQSTRESYALDLRLVLSYLSHSGIDWVDATLDDLESYEHWRRRHEDNPLRISGAKWSRERAAIQLLYSWASARDIVGNDPAAGLAQPRDVRSARVRWLTPRALSQWKRVGLTGYQSSGLRDPHWDSVVDDRNVSMVDLLYASGMRIREAGSLFVTELPASGDGASLPGMSSGFIAAACAKGRRRRQFWITASALSSVEAYVTTSRRFAVRQANQVGRYDEVADMRLVRSVARSTGVLSFTERDGRPGRIAVDAIAPEERTRYYREGMDGVEPLLLWLDASGRPVRYRHWTENVFPSANRRCAQLGLALHCTPHMCRHSFALRMLVTLEYALSSRAGMTPEERRREDLLLGSPFDLVRDLLGHASTTTTRKHYLEPLAGLRVEHLLGQGEDDDDLHRIIARIAERSPMIQDFDPAGLPA